MTSVTNKCSLFKNDLMYLDSVNCMTCYVNHKVNVRNLKAGGSFSRSKTKLFVKFRKSEIFQDFQEQLIYSSWLGEEHTFFHVCFG